MKRFLSWLGVWLLLCAFPYIFIGSAVESFQQEKSRIARELVAAHLQQWSAGLIQKSGNTLQTIRRHLELLARRSLTKGIGYDRAHLESGMRRFEKRFPLQVRWYPLDREGLPLLDLTDPQGRTGILKRLHQTATTLSRDPSEGDRLLKLHWPLLSGFIGKEAQPGIFPVVGGGSTIGPGESATERAWFFGFITADGALFAHVDHPAGFEFIGIREHIDRLKPTLKRREWVAGMQEHPALPTGDPDLDLALGEYRFSGLRLRSGTSSLVHIHPLPRGGVVWVKCPIAVLADHSGTRLHFFLGLIFILGTLLCLILWKTGSRISISLRWRLPTLFLFAVLIPLSALIAAGWDYLGQKERLAFQSSRTRLERTLREIDTRFPAFTNRLGTRLRAFLIAHPPPVTQSRPVLDAWVASFSRRFHIDSLELVDHKGLPIGRFKRAASTIRCEPMFRAMCRDLIHWMTGNKADRVSTVGSLWGDRQLLLSETGKVAVWNLLNQPTCMFILPEAGRLGSYPVALYALWNYSDLAFMFVGDEGKAEARRNPGTHLHARISEQERFLSRPSATGRRILAPLVHSLQARLESGNDAEFVRYRQKEGVHGVGVVCSRILDMQLLGLRGDREVLRDVRFWKTGLICFSLFSLVLAIYLAILLSTQVLVPLGQLAEGVTALREHDFKKRLPPSPDDEFGDLMLAFNHMLEGLSELEVGRIVQESLFPTALVSGSDWSAIGRSRPATQVGGDFYDIQPLTDGRLLVLLGDVTGHGVAPGLVMAMVKGLVEYEVEQKTEPMRLMTVIHVVLSQSLPWFYQMTAVLGLIEPQRAGGPTLKLVTAGHPPPLRLRSGQKPFRYQTSSMPLGIKYRPRLGTIEDTLLPGDLLLFTTDGWYETPDLSGKPIGFERLSEAAERFIDADLEASRDRMFTWIETLCGPNARTDDLTLLIVRVG